MKTQKDKVVYHPDTKTLEVNGKLYARSHETTKKIGRTFHVDKIMFKPADEAEILKQRAMVASKLAGSIWPERVAEEVVKEMSLVEVNKLYKLLSDKKAKVKPQDGCLGLEITSGKKKAYVSIFD